MFDTKTIEHLKYYVYLLIDPITDEPFYVGKGLGNRVFYHVNNPLQIDIVNSKHEEIKRIKSEGNQVKHLIVRHGLTESNALEIESALIDTFKFIPKFEHYVRGNIQGGVNSIEKGLMTVNEVIRLYNAEPLNEIEENCVIININKTYDRGSGENAIYQATKEIWDITEYRRNRIEFVLSEYKGLIVEVFKVESWYSKERGYNKGAKKYGKTYLGYGFEGTIAEQNIKEKYINKTISPFKKRGFASVLIFPETLQKLKNN
ncbi:hypothetical protein [Lacinutrix sp.]|uniref:LEM-3-like GIY-YIG domain-containing protein n=1 Tax=Lacinutrix sp. TaxID=1937692 RepID=UPI0025C1ADF9|nr:hypothetical protein [Lacinutrix sp.]